MDTVFPSGRTPGCLPEGFCRRMDRLFCADAGAFWAGYEAPVRRGLRVNTLKTTVGALRAVFPLPLRPLPFAQEGFAVEGDFRAGADPLHHAGAYYMQEPSAMAAVAVLAPRPGERILDLCAAPGGKSTQIAAALQGQGLLWSNEYVRGRAQILAQNLERCGVRNAVVSNAPAPLLGERLAGWFDGVLVDAPCSGEGMFRKEPEALSGWSEDNIRMCAARQQEILDAAARAVRPGGRLVYSTCTFAPEENECAVARFLRRHPEFQLEPVETAFGCPGFDWERVAGFDPGAQGQGLPLSFCRRILPGQGGEGHFIARLRRKEEEPPAPVPPYVYDAHDTNRNMADELYAECMSDVPQGVFQTVGRQVRLLPEGLPDMSGLHVLAAGVAAAEVCRNRLEPCHGLFMAARAADCRRVVDLELADPRLAAFLRGEELEIEGEPGWTAVCAAGVVTGFGKASARQRGTGTMFLKNRYPKGLRTWSA